MKYNELPKDIQDKIQEIAKQYPYTCEEIVDCYLMAGSDKLTHMLLHMKMKGMPDSILRLYVNKFYERKMEELSKLCELHKENEQLTDSVRLLSDEYERRLLLQEENKKLKKQLRQCEIIVNNVLYFDDDGDYVNALWEVLNVTQGRSRYEDGDEDVKLEYIEEG